MKTAYIIGSSSQGRVIASIIDEKYKKIFFVDVISYYTTSTSIKPKRPSNIIEEEFFFENIDKYAQEDIFIGVGDNEIRTKIYSKLNKLNIIPTNAIAKNAFIAKDASLGKGIVICHGALVGSRAKVGDNTIINSISSIDHDCEVGPNSHIAAGVTLGGYTIIGENCFLGIKSATIPKIRIGNKSVVMAGSMVYKDVLEGVMVGGNPARLMKRVD